MLPFDDYSQTAADQGMGLPDPPNMFKAGPVDGGFATLERPFEAERDPTLGETWHAAFEAENSVVNGFDMLFGRKKFDRDSNYPLADDLEQRYPDLLLNYRSEFALSGSKEETDYIAGQIRHEQQNQATLAKAGWAGTIAGFTAANADPLILAPYIRLAKIGREAVSAGMTTRQVLGLGAAEGALNVGAAVLAQEAILQGNQYTRDQWDTASNIAVGMIMGSLFGGAMRYMAPRDKAIAHDAIKSALEDDPVAEGGISNFVMKDYTDPAAVLKPALMLPNPAREFTFSGVHANTVDIESFDELMPRSRKGAPPSAILASDADTADDTLARFITQNEADNRFYVEDAVRGIADNSIRGQADRLAARMRIDRLTAEFPALAPVVRELSRVRRRQARIYRELQEANTEGRSADIERLSAEHTRLSNEWDMQLSLIREVEQANPPKIDEGSYQVGARMRRVRMRMDNPMVIDMQGRPLQTSGGRQSRGALLRAAHDAGHDSAIFINTEGDGIVYAVFNPRNIRTAWDPMFTSDWFQVTDAMRRAAKEAELQGRPRDVLGPEGIAPRVEAPTTGARAAAVGAEASKPAATTEGFLISRMDDNAVQTTVARASKSLIRLAARGFVGARVLTSKSPTIATAGARILDMGMTMQENALHLDELGQPLQPSTVAPGGTVENRTKSWIGELGQFMFALDQNFIDYRTGKKPALFAVVAQRTKDVLKDRALKGTEKIASPEQPWAFTHMADGTDLTWSAFNEEVAKAARRDTTVYGDHPIPQVAKAAADYRRIIEEPMAAAAEQGKLFTALKVDKDGFVHLWRRYNIDKIAGNMLDFVKLLKQSWINGETAEFREGLGKLKASQALREEDIADLRTGVEDYDAAVAARETELAGFKAKAENVAFAALEDELDEVRRVARRATTPPQERATAEQRAKDIAADLKKMRKSDPEYAAYVKGRNRLKQRLANVRTGVAGLTGKSRQMLDRAEGLERENIDQMQRMAEYGANLQGKIDELDDAALDAELARFRTAFAQLAERYDEATEAITRAEGDTSLAVTRQESRAERLDRIAGRLEKAEAFDRAGAMAELQNALEAVAVRKAEAISGRAERASRLRERARTEGPARAEARIKKLTERGTAKTGAFAQRWEKLADNVDMEAGTISLDSYAEDLAYSITQKIIGNDITSSAITDLLAGPRGPELQRMLTFVPEGMLEPWLENNITTLAQSYVRTVAPDIELARMFGSVDFSQNSDFYTKALADRDALAALAKTEAERIKVNDQWNADMRDFNILVNRLRNRRGVPSDPSSWTYKMGSSMMLLNYTRLLGMQTVGSMSDIMKPVFHMGIMRAYGDIWAPFISSLQDASKRISRQKLLNEVWSLGVGNDFQTDIHALTMGDMLTELVHRKNIAGRVIEGAANNFGMISLMSGWNAWNRKVIGAAVMKRMLENIEHVTKGTADETTIARLEELNRAGIDENYARRIWHSMTNNTAVPPSDQAIKRLMDRDGLSYDDAVAQLSPRTVEAPGGEFIDGQWVPESANWLDKDARRALAAAMQREVNIINVQGSLGRPAWMDEHIAFRMAGQFRLFNMESTARTLGAGMQQRDSAVLQGAVGMMGMGAIAYFVRSVLAGGETLREMQEMPPAAFAAKALDQSGLMAIFGDLNRVAEATALGGIAQWAGADRRFRPDHVGLMSAVLGPSFDFGIRTAKLGSDIAEQGARALGQDVSGGINGYTVHNFRTLWPLQNTRPFSYGFDAVERGMVNLFGLEPRKDL